jgi:hypothetical protein
MKAVFSNALSCLHPQGLLSLLEADIHLWVGTRSTRALTKTYENQA